MERLRRNGVGTNFTTASGKAAQTALSRCSTGLPMFFLFFVISFFDTLV